MVAKENPKESNGRRKNKGKEGRKGVNTERKERRKGW